MLVVLRLIFVFSTGNNFLGGKFSPKTQNCQFKLKFGIKTNSYMQNSMMIFAFSVFDHKYPSWANLVQKFKIICLK